MTTLRFQLTLLSFMLTASQGLAEVLFYRGTCTKTFWDADHFFPLKTGVYYVIDTDSQNAAEIRVEPQYFWVETFRGVKTTVMPDGFNPKFVVFSMSTLTDSPFGDTLNVFHFRGRVNKAVVLNWPSVLTGRRDYISENTSAPLLNPKGYYAFTEYNLRHLDATFFPSHSTNLDSFRHAVEDVYDFVSAHRIGFGDSLPWERGTLP